MSKYVFPAVFRWDEEDKVYYVNFPDIEGCFTDGETLDAAVENADDVLNLMLWNMEHQKQDIPEPTPFTQVTVPEKGFVNLIVADTTAYQDVIDRENNPIKYARKKAGLNVKGLAELLGAPYRTVQEWNAGNRMPPKWVQRLIIEKIEATITHSGS